MIAEHLNPEQQRAGRFVRFEYNAASGLLRNTDQGG